MNNCEHRYPEIRDWNTLHETRERIHTLLDLHEQEIANDFMVVKELLKPSNLKEQLMNQAYGKLSLFRSAVNGFYTVKSFFTRKNKTHNTPSHRCDCGCGCDY